MMEAGTAGASSATEAAWRDGASYIDGRYVPIAEAAIPVMEWGYRRSDVTYDVVGVWQGSFFRLDDHLKRFSASLAGMRMQPKETIEDVRAILHELVKRTGLREAYCSMECLRGVPPAGMPRRPAYARNWMVMSVIPWVWVVPEDVQARGAHLIVAKTPKIPDACVDPTVKNFHWGDMTKALFEAEDAGADNAILLDFAGNVTEGPGFNVFAVVDGVVVSPDRGALEGVTRLSVFELCGELGIPVEVRPLPAGELRDADEIFLATTAGGIMPASRIDGRIMGNDRPGPLSSQLRERFWARRAEGWHATPVDYGSASS